MVKIKSVTTSRMGKKMLRKAFTGELAQTVRKSNVFLQKGNIHGHTIEIALKNIATNKLVIFSNILFAIANILFCVHSF